MRCMFAMCLVLSGIMFWTGCGGADRPPPPEGHVDPGTDPAAMSKEMSPKP